MSSKPDLVIVGGGLAGGLAALALADRKPDLELRLIERQDSLGGNHVWSFFDSDIAPDHHPLLAPLIVQRWESNAVRFPRRRRQLDARYQSITSDRFHAHLRDRLGENIVHADVVALRPDGITFADGTDLPARAVLDARGISEAPEGLDCGWQKFVGQMIEVKGGHGLAQPIIMDATVDQSDGYRFVYLLPFDEERIFVEDTYYQEGAALDRRLLSQRIGAFVASQGWENHRVLHEEKGVLPVVIGGEFDEFWPAEDVVARAGVAGGFFHPLTSYSLPDAVRFAFWLADAMPMDGRTLAAATRSQGEREWRDGRFYRLLGKMLFRAADPADRYKIFQRFYGLPDGLIERFYAGKSTLADKVRILAGKPPVPILRAVRALME
ncbi:lycopene beta-cyclase CrtY [Sphingomicrobium sp. XHP0239]|uniref:lycopene beta-cyclase CrtY n=1 Tax=Sphingomicrobium maritimum TaxID=3133972 RepID=UPI0031CC39FC